MFRLEACKTTRAYKAHSSTRIDLALVKHSEHVIMDAGPVLVITVGGIEVIIHSYGELMIKTPDEHTAARIATHLEAYLERHTPA